MRKIQNPLSSGGGDNNANGNQRSGIRITTLLGMVLIVLSSFHAGRSFCPQGSQLNLSSSESKQQPEEKECLSWPLNQMLEESKGTLARDRGNRIKDWANLLQKAAGDSSSNIKEVRGAEIGVFEGEFAKEMLSQLYERNLLQEYILVDPWRHLDEWNKPYNKQDDEFNRIYDLAMSRTKEDPRFGTKVTVLRDMSYEASLKVQDQSLDFVYIDGDHTAKGAMKDLLLWVPKVKCGGLGMQ